MTGRTHQILGLTVGLAAYFAASAPQYSPATLAAVGIFSSIGGLLPDIDQSASEIWHTIPLGHAAAKIVDPFLEHRNITHSLLGMILAGIGLFFLLKLFPDYWGIDTYMILIVTEAAYASHLLADSVTVEGIPLFWPVGWMVGIPPKPFEGMRIMTGKWFENLIIFPLIYITFAILIINSWPVIKTILFK